MPIIARKELAELCGDGITSINKWIERGKLVHVDGNKKLIDTNNPINSLFIDQRKEANEQKKLLCEVKYVAKSVKSVIEKPKSVSKTSKKILKQAIVKADIKPEKPIKTAKIKAVPIKKEPILPAMTAQQRKEEARRMNDQNLRAIIKIDQEAKKRQQDLDLQEIRIQTEKMRLDKTAGNLLPVDLALGLIERHANSILKTFEKGFERIADIYANFAGMDPTQRTDFIKECRIELSNCVENAGKSAEAEIDILVDNYAETLMVGQKKA